MKLSNRFYFIPIILVALVSIHNAKAQEKYSLYIKSGVFKQYSHTHTANIDGIILQNASPEPFSHFQLGIQLRKKLVNRVDLIFNLDLPLGGLIDSYLMYDTEEDQFFGTFVEKALTKGVSTTLLSLSLSYELISIKSLKMNMHFGPEVMLNKNKDIQSTYNLGRQHPRLNEIAPLLDNIYKKAIWQARFGISASYKRFMLEIVHNDDFGQSVTNTVNYQGTLSEISTSRRLTSLTLGYRFLKL